MSMQEAQAREQAEAASSSTAASAPAASVPSVPEHSAREDEALLQEAIEASKATHDVNMDGEDVQMDDDEDEEAAIARAIEMSMQQAPPDDGKDKK